MQTNWTLSVSQLNEYVRVQLASDPVLRDLTVEGEISGFKRAVSGHLYFTLKDDSARVQCVMFRQSAAGLDFRPTDGMKVTLRGSASLFVRDGSYQVYVEAMQQQGLGDLYRQFLILKERLAREGLFDPAIKRPIPEFPRCVGIATSATGAVLHDILRVGWKRWPNMRFVLAPCSVQGKDAADEIVKSISLLNRNAECDVILCGRGGGSLEDLWPFNEEKVARAIRNSRIPVISCVGHETDFTIADFAADARAATPSNAAEIAIPERSEFLDEIRSISNTLDKEAKIRLEMCGAQLKQLLSSYVLKDPAGAWVAPRKRDLSDFCRRLDVACMQKNQAVKSEFAVLKTKLDALQPGAPLRRGYALIEKNGIAVESASELGTGDKICVHMKDGGFAALLQEKLERGAWEHGTEKGTDI